MPDQKPTKPSAGLDRLNDRLRAVGFLETWLDLPIVLQKAETSALHRLQEQMATGKALHLLAVEGQSASIYLKPGHIQTFVVQHDWASAFQNAVDFESGDFQMPFEACCFEFKISGVRVCAVVSDRDDQKTIILFVDLGGIWTQPSIPYELTDGQWKPTYREDEEDHMEKVRAFLARQIRAVCVSLEAEVAKPETHSPPPKLNAARVRRGHLPLFDYHIVRLNRGPRTHRIEGDGEHSRVRLHFRRGHWRRLSEEKRTWVRWCLVGDPDLGFIEKEYRL